MEKRPALQKYIPDAYKLLKELDGIVKNGIEPIILELIKQKSL